MFNVAKPKIFRPSDFAATMTTLAPVCVRAPGRVVDRGGVQPTRTINLPSPRRCRALARDQHFVKVMPRDFVGQRLSGTGGLPG
jgi:hypothetical protein